MSEKNSKPESSKSKNDQPDGGSDYTEPKETLVTAEKNEE
jgi:hypothetical protein